MRRRVPSPEQVGASKAGAEADERCDVGHAVRVLAGDLLLAVASAFATGWPAASWQWKTIMSGAVLDVEDRPATLCHDRHLR